MEADEARWKQRFDRERTARREAERLLEEKSRELYQANRNLESQARDLETVVAERTRRLAANQEGLVELNRVLLGLGDSYSENIDKLTQACGEILGADAVLFSTSGDSELAGQGRWHAGSALDAEDLEPTEVCRAIVSRGPEEGVLVGDDPGRVDGAGEEAFRTGAGYPVIFHGQLRGVLTAFYRSPAVLDPFREQILEMIATAIGSEQHRDRTQKELAEKERRFSEVFERSMDGIVIHDPNGEILEVNKTAARLLGYERRTMIGMTLPSLHPEKWLPACKEALGKVAESGADRFEAEFIRRDGSTFLAEISASSFELGEQTLIQGIIRDITEKRRLEDEREEAARELARAKEEAERANAAKSVFLANLSHEIRTPLNGIIGFTDVLAGTGLSKDQDGYLRTIRASGEVLLNIINDTLDLSRIEQGRIELNDETFSPGDCVSEAAEILAAKADESGLELTTRIDGAVPDRIRGDPNRVRQIILNLINNALKFTPEGSVTVSLGPDPEAADSRIFFEVTDTGIGISTADRERLFEPFTQFGEGAESREGAGLGLAICKSLVEAMGGTIGCDSEPGKGSRFWFRLPARETGAASGESPRLQIALAIGNNITREVLGALVSAQGHGADEFESLDSFLDDAPASDYDFVLADGSEISRLHAGENRSREWSGRLVAVADDPDTELSELCGDRIIRLPVDPAQLERALSRETGPAESE